MASEENLSGCLTLSNDRIGNFMWEVSDYAKKILAELSPEDREKFVKLLSSKTESAKVMIRQVRGDVMHELKKAYETKVMTEDEKFAQEKKLQELTDKFVELVDQLGEKKKQELLTV